MRYRTTILFLIACVLAAYPALKSNQMQAACADSFSSNESGSSMFFGSNESPGCAAQETTMDRTLQLLAAIAALGGCASAVKSWRDRRQDSALLQGSRPPLWGRGVPYR